VDCASTITEPAGSSASTTSATAGESPALLTFDRPSPSAATKLPVFLEGVVDTDSTGGDLADEWAATLGQDERVIDDESPLSVAIPLDRRLTDVAALRG
jgi:hypothetical protein